MTDYRICLCILLMGVGWSSVSSGAGAGVTQESFGRMPDGTQVNVY